MIILIDNYDSFTYNLFHYLGDLGVETLVRRNDKISVGQVISANTMFSAITLVRALRKGDHSGHASRGSFSLCCSKVR